MPRNETFCLAEVIVIIIGIRRGQYQDRKDRRSRIVEVGDARLLATNTPPLGE